MSEYADLVVHWLAHDQGGRKEPVDVRAGGGSYKPHLRLVSGGELLGVAFIDGQPPIIDLGGEGTASVALIYADGGVDYSSLKPAAEFEVVEGHRVVGRGTVIRRWVAEDDWRDRSREGS
jgi:hypothetical protein